jgi:hypothetical protein
VAERKQNYELEKSNSEYKKWITKDERKFKNEEIF